MLGEKDDLVGKKLIMKGGRKVAVINHDKTNEIFELLVLKNKINEEISEGVKFKVTEQYLEQIGFKIVKEDS